MRFSILYVFLISPFKGMKQFSTEYMLYPKLFDSIFEPDVWVSMIDSFHQYADFLLIFVDNLVWLYCRLYLLFCLAFWPWHRVWIAIFQWAQCFQSFHENVFLIPLYYPALSIAFQIMRLFFLKAFIKLLSQKYVYIRIEQGLFIRYHNKDRRWWTLFDKSTEYRRMGQHFSRSADFDLTEISFKKEKNMFLICSFNNPV